ncbi:nicotinate-nucleotide--dimethylbenzimidazole phosphoribosyltransferase [Shewanella cyperi]|uniref:Nicotinate-nucleotide--dimethylbenzimidazole phosphoribosyltransferase n=1 Tax=Shewanella cyperi TaxID=2814292 RepID=A0A974XJ40_9GAMM|nr:nicotinate-nucleotide--dimethylbenzimidazole phosphoribosyltransferase [Shewanella cyperi]QSX29316.1 nicotinate-nucleotide--dimethylbenzimidazole phosphoribosyltransferase [Shewanella cyperi]
MFTIEAVSDQFDQQIQQRIDDKTKPLGALGRLESLALTIARVQGKETLEITRPTMLVFAGDHGIAASGVSIAPSEVTAQMLLNFARGGAAINVFCRQLGWELELIDCGILQPLEGLKPGDCGKEIVNCRLGAGTNPIHRQAAMTLGAVHQGFELAKGRVVHHHSLGCNLLGLGDMGIGNSSSAAALMAAMLGLEAGDCVGRGTGIDAATLKRKTMLVEQALVQHHDELTDTYNKLACLGGFEIVQMTGAILAAAELRMLVLIDGFIATAAALCAVELMPACRDYLVFAHASAERGHQRMLQHLKAEPLLDLGMRLGEGSGAALALPLVQAAVNFYNDMASFAEAGVNKVV